MPIITLTTDMGIADFSVASIKAAILRDLPNASIVDVTHAIPCFNIPAAAFIIKNAYVQFPIGTIHLVAVDGKDSSNASLLAIKVNGHYFIGADNGLFGLVFKQSDESILLTIPPNPNSLSFIAKDITVKAAVHIAKGGNILEIGHKHKNYLRFTESFPIYDHNSVRTTILHIDKYGNCVFNLEKSIFERVRRNRKFSIEIKGDPITTIFRRYNDVPCGNLVALFTSYGLLEISMSYGNFAELLGYKIGHNVLITFTY
jgi:S-adenosylmethionine hydrolase